MDERRATIERVRSLAKRFTYSPGASLNVNVPLDSPTMLHFQWLMPVKDSERVGQETVVQTAMVHPIDWFDSMTDQQIVEEVFSDGFRRLILHEHDEWARFDGKVIREPHPEHIDRRMFGRRDAFAPPPDFKGLTPLLPPIIDEAADWQWNKDLPSYKDLVAMSKEALFAQRYAARDAKWTRSVS